MSNTNSVERLTTAQLSQLIHHESLRLSALKGEAAELAERADQLENRSYVSPSVQDDIHDLRNQARQKTGEAIAKEADLKTFQAELASRYGLDTKATQHATEESDAEARARKARELLGRRDYSDLQDAHVRKAAQGRERD